MLIENQKIFELNMNGYKVINYKQDIFNLFIDKNVPICIINEDYNVSAPIGFVQKPIKYIDDFLFGNIFIWNNLYNEYVFDNCEVAGQCNNDMSVYIDYIVTIVFKE